METVQSVEVFKVGMAHPTDLAGVVSLVEAGALDLRDLVAVIGKTEGTGEVDDPNRATCERALTDLLVKRAGLAEGEVNVFAKAIVPGHGTCRGRRFCMLEDRVLGTKPARAIVNAVIASVTGDPMNFVSGGEVDSHQGPPDGMPCAAIVRVA